ncbi:MAG: hypothetical protein ACTS5I_09600 [Rhodanobacter sp.]
MTEFEAFFKWAGETVQKLDAYESGPVFSDGSGINDASWDRKYAFLLFMFTKGLPPP